MAGEGVMAGVADLFLMFPAKGYHGLFIEMKAGKGRQTERQADFERRAEAIGYRYEVARNTDEFMKIIRGYMGCL
jgi:hypothetical protein